MTKPIPLYTYTGCSTCRAAVKWLQEQGIPFEERPIYTQPPSMPELRRMLVHAKGDLKRLFNTSGLEYRAQNLKSTLPTLSEEQALKLLSTNGKLVKRPFLLDEDLGLLGFKPEEWKARLLP